MQNKNFKYKKFTTFIIIFFMYITNISIYLGIWSKSYEINTFGDKGDLVLYSIYIFLYIILTGVYKGNKIGILRLGEIIYSNVLSIIILNIITYLQLCTLQAKLSDFLPIAQISVYQFLSITLFSYIANKVYFKLRTAREILAICDDINTDYEILLKMQQIHEKYIIKKVIREDIGQEEILRQLNNFSSILICNLTPQTKRYIIEHCFEKNKRVYIIPSVYDIMLWSSYQTQVFDTPMLMCKSNTPSNEELIMKRIIDILFSSIGLVLAAPFMVISAILIKIYDGGPIFFKQKRITIDSNIFTILKFRSMIVDAEKDGAKKATSNDDRITPVGKILRLLRLDETPQLLNILKGDMSIVGPRPERVENVEEYTAQYPQFTLRLKVKPGLTGYAQIYGKYNTSPLDKLHLDLLYIQNFSILKDFSLMLATIKILLMPTSTEGFHIPENSNDTTDTNDSTNINDNHSNKG
ncbi:MAG: exopolysaccharide biosynthesis polyprenyl glycosylphosphotransferase [Oscillospiraceae bacterium]